MLTIQHREQKVAYIEFKADNDESAKTQSEIIFNDYKIKPSFMTHQPYISGNFTGIKPVIESHHVSKLVYSETAVNAWGQFCGGYWSTIKEW